MTTHEFSALNILNVVRQQTDRIGIGISFGKDSLTTLDLCSKVFDNLHGYYLYRVENLRIIREWQKFTESRWPIKIHMYPHFDLSRCYSNAVLRPHSDQSANVPRITLVDIENYFKTQTGCIWMALGWRRNDSFSRALIMKQTGGYDPKNTRVFPLRAFTRRHVLEYLKENNIPLPPGLGRKEQGGLDFHPEALRTLKEQYPDDYAKWLTDFPFSDMQLLDNYKEEK
jgi:3'-phosphoadenosine 5'-phosphosulfate sulfotransferase (PAPS reductase)/FAD synthetase